MYRQADKVTKWFTMFARPLDLDYWCGVWSTPGRQSFYWERLYHCEPTFTLETDFSVHQVPGLVTDRNQFRMGVSNRSRTTIYSTFLSWNSFKLKMTRVSLQMITLQTFLVLALSSRLSLGFSLRTYLESFQERTSGSADDTRKFAFRNRISHWGK